MQGRSAHSVQLSLHFIAVPLDEDIAPSVRGNLWARFYFKVDNGKSGGSAAFMGFEGPPSISDAVIPRRTSLLPDFALARARIHECSQRHSSCPDLKPRPLPTRVIDVGEDIRHGSRLVETRGELGQYLALSHCWGNIQPRPLMTTTENISAMTTRIPFERLGKTFQDAMTVTKELGYRYLWIDMFCIVQNSSADWQQECSNMASIFANADLTIAASAAKDSNAGFLQERPLWHTNIVEWVRHQSRKHQDEDGNIRALNFQVKNIPNQAMVTSLPGEEDGGYPPNYFMSAKNDILSTRAWAVQERLLPSRILSFYESQTIFECNTCLWYEKMHHPLLHRDCVHRIHRARESLVPKDFLDADDAQTIFNRWISILELYTSCSITMADDRLPALSGVVQRIQERLGDEYTAGLWHSHIMEGLSWQVSMFPREYTITQFSEIDWISDNYTKHKDIGLSVVKHQRTVYIPSWSWASCAYRIQMPNAYYPVKHAEVVEVRSTAAGLDRFGNVTSGTVRITGHLRTLEWRATGIDIVETLFLYREDGKSLPVVRADRVFRDRVVPGDKGQLTCFLLSANGPNACILVLELVSLPNAYRRIGMISTDIFGLGWPVQPREYIDRDEIIPWFLEAERLTIDII
ncbi:hypothetical protein PFICI_04875 [Pestalotiopsis fici W106-1]|uniref:Heterokaryon incompatibility domain-containing protein n=1 Tax=Pestalotiopsis fici (strain W106-1 / CGMCC3.15140) TaxID=1229662 RepID=W3XAE3_PESFW|nr:uncharacterized protein PFICI_04875 [Pestalotiopsis fici W106-1]ETS82999.1 hypothetical protein PFICI_04875 [Pestalotiopsis fici W106-1]